MTEQALAVGVAPATVRRETAVAGSVPKFEISEWRERFGVVAGITGRGGESAPFDLGLAGANTSVGQVMGRWRRFRESVPEFPGVVVSQQVHGTAVLWHDVAAGLTILDAADGHATSTPGLLLGVTAADCVPVYLIDPIRRAVALLHAGWRGTAGGILARGVELLLARGSVVDNLLIHCGIGICGSCYEVGSEVFIGCGVAVPPAGRGWLDVRSVLVRQARELGVENVSTSPFCSMHDQPLFFSHRASGGADGRMVAYLGLSK
ncbi:MAG: polyphenol oxidase family protein [Gemmatimonadales bacterium]|nr:polyphenol oxidase family protein [Gemmatimonadales bacterium]